MPLRICTTPLLILPAALNHIISAVSRAEVIPANVSSPGAQQAPQPQEGVAVIQVHGVLTYRGDDIFSWLFGGITYDDIRAQFRSALSDPSVKAIIFDIDSPGGEAAGAFDLVDEIYQARGTKPIYAVANETAYSAAYAIASAADMIYVPRTGGMGSIGVIAMHVDQSTWDENTGVKYTPIFAGAHKNDFTPHEPLSAEAKAAGQAMVDEVYDIFVKTVARNRGMTPADVRSTEAALYQGKNAVDAGLADAVMPWDKAVTDIFRKNQIKGGTTMTLVERIKALFASAPAEEITPGLAEAGFIAKEESDRLVQNAKDSAQEEVMAGVIGILEVCSVAGMEKMALELVRDKLTIEQARERIINAKAAEAEKTQIRSTVGALSTGGVNPLIEDAKKRASDANIRVVKK
jgi:signal peptide peptidase SppA